MSPYLYVPIYPSIIGFLSMIMGLKLMMQDGDSLAIGEENKGNFIFPLILSTIFAIWIGLRPVSGVFGDTVNYARVYNMIGPDAVSDINLSAEWLWGLLETSCKHAGLSVHIFFLIIEIGYVFTALCAIKKFVPTSPYLGFLFLFSSLMFFTFGVNGLRNGLACHIILLAMAFLMEDKRVIAIILAFLALGIHKSVMLPIVGVISAITVIKNPKWAFYIWLASIVISLLWGEYLTQLIVSIGFDDRMSSYANATEYNSLFSSTGFRWDFLLYSSIPIIMYWYVNIWKDLRDGWYNIISTTYMLANSFWIIVIRMPFSNRFAYLSWFLYPIMIVYPLCNMRAWENQDRVAGQILIAYASFTIFMIMFFWN